LLECVKTNAVMVMKIAIAPRHLHVAI